MGISQEREKQIDAILTVSSVPLRLWVDVGSRKFIS